jgi:hypothetical protein
MRLNLVVHSVTIAWYLFAIPLLSFPSTIPVLANTMNCGFCETAHTVQLETDTG